MNWNGLELPNKPYYSDDVLNDGKISKSAGQYKDDKLNTFKPKSALFPLGYQTNAYAGDAGSFSRYFDLDAWFAEKIKQLPKSAQKTFPFLIVPKASKNEKNKYLDGEKLPVAERAGRDNTMNSKQTPEGKPQSISPPERNFHPTVKPLKLMSYLVTLGSRSGDIILDPFMGSGTTNLACQIFGRKCIGIEIEEKYCEIAANRCRQSVMELNL